MFYDYGLGIAFIAIGIAFLCLSYFGERVNKSWKDHCNRLNETIDNIIKDYYGNFRNNTEIIRKLKDENHQLYTRNRKLTEQNLILKTDLRKVIDEVKYIRDKVNNNSSSAEKYNLKLMNLLEEIFTDSETKLSRDIQDKISDLYVPANMLSLDQLSEKDSEGYPVFYIGDEVIKVTGYPYPGVISGVTTTLAGKRRYTVESTQKATIGMLHIFSGQNLRLTKAGRKREIMENLKAEDLNETSD